MAEFYKEYKDSGHETFRILANWDNDHWQEVNEDNDLCAAWIAQGNALIEIAYRDSEYPFDLDALEPERRMRAAFWVLVKERYGLDETEARERLLDAVADPSTDEAIQILAVRKNLTAEVQQLEADYQASLEE